MIFKSIIPDEYYLFSSDGYPCSWVIIATASDNITNVNSGFKQFVTAVGIYYATTNPLWLRTTYFFWPTLYILKFGHILLSKDAMISAQHTIDNQPQLHICEGKMQLPNTKGHEKRLQYLNTFHTETW